MKIRKLEDNGNKGSEEANATYNTQILFSDSNMYIVYLEFSIPAPIKLSCYS